MSKRTFTFEIVDLYNSHENRDKIRRFLGDDLLEIDRVKPHVIVATSQDPEKVRVALEYKTGKKVILLNRHSQPSQISLQQKYGHQHGSQPPQISLQQKYRLQHGKGKQGSIVPTSNHLPATAQVQAALHNILQPGLQKSSAGASSSSSNHVAAYIQNLAVNVNINNYLGPITTTNVQAPQVITGATLRRRPKSYHEHSLILTEGRKSSYKCSGCKELGMGDRYVCNDCSYILHQNCMYYEERATHKFFEGSTFIFHQKRLNSTNRICDACGSDIHGFFYHSENNKDLHPCCLRLPETVLLEGRNFRLCKRLTSKCFHCGSRKKDDKDKCWCYSSERQNLQSHVSCMKDARSLQMLNCGT